MNAVRISALPVLCLLLGFLSACGEDPVTAAPTSFTVTYDANGAATGSVPTDPATYAAGDPVTLRSNTGALARAGHGLAGWTVAGDGSGRVYPFGATLPMPAAGLTLRAKWATNVLVAGPYTYTLGFGGTGYILTGVDPGAGLTDLVVPATAQEVPVRAIGGLLPLSIESVSLSSNLFAISNYAFNSMALLRRIELPAGLVTIGDLAFNNCSKLTAVTLPAGLRSIGMLAFSGCVALWTVDIPGGVTNLGIGVFNGSGLTIATFQAPGPAVIPLAAFDGCLYLTRLVLGAGLRGIGPVAFSDCRNLVDITLPAGVTNVGTAAFDGCDLATVTALPALPPGTGPNFLGTFTGRLKVPAASINAYTNDAAWGAYRTQTFPL